MKEILYNQLRVSESMREPTILIWLVPVLVIVLGLKLVCLWKAARRNQMGWFIALGILNTFGLLEIVYLIFFRIKGKAKVE